MLILVSNYCILVWSCSLVKHFDWRDEIREAQSTKKYSAIISYRGVGYVGKREVATIPLSHTFAYMGLGVVVNAQIQPHTPYCLNRKVFFGRRGEKRLGFG